ncbi:ankyrin repeat-containing domain protein, partial [Baffinella frigidus]
MGGSHLPPSRVATPRALGLQHPNAHLPTPRASADQARPGSARRDENWELLRAAEEGDLDAISMAIRKGASVHYHSPTDGATALHASARCNHVAAIRLLLAQNAALEALDLYKQTPLHAAALSGALAAVMALMDLGADISAPDEEGCTPLHLAARNAHPGVILAFLRLGADVEAALELHAHPGVILAFFRLGADVEANVEAKSLRGATPADLAGQRADVRTLIAKSLSGATPADLAGHADIRTLIVCERVRGTVCERVRGTVLDEEEQSWRALPQEQQHSGNYREEAAEVVPRWRAVLVFLSEALAGCAQQRRTGPPT